MSTSIDRPPPRRAAPELIVLARAEDFTTWFLEHTRRWPKSARFTITQRLENLALDVVDDLVVARYERRGRGRRLDRVNLALERMRHLLRIAGRTNISPSKTLDAAMVRLDEIGRILHGWRAVTSGRRPADNAP